MDGTVLPMQSKSESVPWMSRTWVVPCTCDSEQRRCSDEWVREAQHSLQRGGQRLATAALYLLGDDAVGVGGAGRIAVDARQPLQLADALTLLYLGVLSPFKNAAVIFSFARTFDQASALALAHKAREAPGVSVRVVWDCAVSADTAEDASDVREQCTTVARGVRSLAQPSGYPHASRLHVLLHPAASALAIRSWWAAASPVGAERQGMPRYVWYMRAGDEVFQKAADAWNTDQGSTILRSHPANMTMLRRDLSSIALRVLEFMDGAEDLWSGSGNSDQGEQFTMIMGSPGQDFQVWPIPSDTVPEMQLSTMSGRWLLPASTVTPPAYFPEQPEVCDSMRDEGVNVVLLLQFGSGPLNNWPDVQANNCIVRASAETITHAELLTLIARTEPDWVANSAGLHHATAFAALAHTSVPVLPFGAGRISLMLVKEVYKREGDDSKVLVDGRNTFLESGFRDVSALAPFVINSYGVTMPNYRLARQARGETVSVGRFQGNTWQEMWSRHWLVRELIAGRGYTRYLEIGCRDDETFATVDAPELKVGVDPVSGGTHRMTSDDFFAQNTDTFDIVFIDGLHEHRQVVRDVENSLAVLRPGGVIVMHDCNPRDQHEAAFPFSPVGHWNGNTWRAFVDIRMRSDVDAAVGHFDHGCGVVVKRPTTKPLVVVGANGDPIGGGDVPFAQFDEHRELMLRLMPAGDLLRWAFPQTWVGSGWDVQRLMRVDAVP